MNQPNKVINWGYEAENMVGLGETKTLEKCVGSQVKNFIDTNSGVNNKWLKELNDVLSKVK